jgi:nucleotide-binding universal stress UspA family protein
MIIKRILCPTDLSSESDEALRYALALARGYEAQLIVFNCQPEIDGPKLTAAEARALLEPSLLPYLGPADLKKLNWKGIVARDEDAGKAIVDQASEHKVDLIVMRSRRRPHRAALMGSTAEAVSRTAPCAVMVTHADERELVGATPREIELKRILVAYDFSDHSELALKYALTLAQGYQSELHLLHVLPRFTLDETEIAWYPAGDEGPYHKAARRLQKAVSAAAHLWCSIKHTVSEGQAYREILNYAARNHINLICLGAHGAGFGMLTLFGSNVDRVLRQASCPVLVARPLKHLQSPSVAEVMNERVMREAKPPVTQSARANWIDD